jgi:RNA polymerase sigma-70 factor, ECF subfamily
MSAANLDAAQLIREAPQPTPPVDEPAQVSNTPYLVRASLAGDRSAFGQLYQRHARMVHGVLLASVPPAEADDLLQDVFLIALRNLASLREPAAFPGWLLTIARNRANDFHRRPHSFDELPAEVASSRVPAHGSAEAHEALNAVRSLPEAYRETLILRLVEGMTGPEIASRTGLTEGSVRVNLHRGMKLLREKIGVTERPCP